MFITHGIYSISVINLLELIVTFIMYETVLLLLASNNNYYNNEFSNFRIDSNKIKYGLKINLTPIHSPKHVNKYLEK